MNLESFRCEDVAHVYGTVCRTVLDSEATALNWKLYLMAVPGAFKSL